MDARRNSTALLRIALMLSVFGSAGAVYRTPNFVVEAATPRIAEQVAVTAERYRDSLAMEWLGKKLPRWYRPCRVTARIGRLGAGGATTFAFDRGEVFGWRMQVQGTLERVLDSVIPHEVSHTIFACHFRRPLPRWADEGAATLVEHESERRKQSMMLRQVFNTSRRISLRRLLSIKEYPRDMQSVLTLYAEGYSLASFLVQRGGKAQYLAFLDDAHRHGWDRAIQTSYKIRDIDALDQRWSRWVMAGSPRLTLPKGQQLAAAGPPVPRQLVVRSQSPDLPEPHARDKAVSLPVTGAGSSEPTAAVQNRETFVAATNEIGRADVSGDGIRPVSGRATSRVPTGRERAENDGWMVEPSSRSGGHRRPASLALFRRGISSTESGSATGHPGQVALGEHGGRSHGSRNWSDFPSRRTAERTVEPGTVSENPFSP